jgi:hypothetical protein
MNSRLRIVIFLVFLLAVGAVLAIKGVQQGWFLPRPQLALSDQPAMLFFTLLDGCECQMTIIRRAATQVAFWELPEPLAINIIRIDFDLQPKIARYYDVARAPALVLVDAEGELIWKQDVGVSDAKPLDLVEAEAQISALLSK